MLTAFFSAWYSASAFGPPVRSFFAAHASWCGRSPWYVSSGTP